MIGCFVASLILAHSFYSRSCCGGQDCHPVPCKELHEFPGGSWRWQGKDFGTGQNWQCHACVEHINGNPQGVYVQQKSDDLPKPSIVEEPIYPKANFASLREEKLKESAIARVINAAAIANGVDPQWMWNVAGIESGRNPHNRTGSYRGLFQLSYEEFNRWGHGDIYDAENNANAAARMFESHRAIFMETFGRYPDHTEAYMIHQQGIEGYINQTRHPDEPAWQNMYSTREGAQKGRGWARMAIWGNLPPIAQKKFGSVDSVTSKQFVDVWRKRVETGAWPQNW